MITTMHSVRRNSPVRFFVVLAILVLGVLGVVGFAQMEYGSEHYVTFTVVAKDDQAGNNSHKYLIEGRNPATGQLTTYQDTDAWFHGKFNSSDVYFGLAVGQTYTCDVYGFRIHFWSSYQNILHCNGVAGG